MSLGTRVAHAGSPGRRARPVLITSLLFSAGSRSFLQYFCGRPLHVSIDQNGRGPQSSLNRLAKFSVRGFACLLANQALLLGLDGVTNRILPSRRDFTGSVGRCVPFGL
jgi:hypothetical protein